MASDSNRVQGKNRLRRNQELFEIARPQVLSEESLGLKSQAFARFRRLESVHIFDGHKLYGSSRLPQFVGEFLGLRDGHVRVLSAMHDEKRRHILRDMKYRRGVLPHFRTLRIVPSEECGQKGVVISIAMSREICGSADFDHGLHSTRDFGEARI